VDLGSPGAATLSIDLSITRWSTPAERDMVVTTLLEQGSARLLQVLRAMPPVGRLSTPGTTGFELRYASVTSAGGTDRIFLLTDRPVGFWEASSSSRTLDYPFTVIELRVRPNGQGDGKIVVAARVSLDRATRTISFEDFGISPVLLQNLRRNSR
jgi:hypothetical protein